MSETQAAMGFERMETQLVREAVRACVELFVEETGRKAMSLMNDKAAQGSFLTATWTYPTTISLELMLTPSNLKDLWSRLRSDRRVCEVVLAVTVRLRGYYTGSDWDQIVTNLAAGGSVLMKRTHSVMDDTATEPFQRTTEPALLLSDNIWAVTLILLSYAPLTSMPKTLEMILKYIPHGEAVQ